MAAWHRTPAQGRWVDHIHAVVVGHPKLAPSAARQITAYLNRKNGLANGGRDDGPQLTPIPSPVFPWPTPPKSKTPRLDVAIPKLEDTIRATKGTGQPGVLRTLKAKLAEMRATRKKRQAQK